MISYTISHNSPHNQYLHLNAQFPTNGQEKIKVQLPAWRPGRYELGNFAQNVQKWQVRNEKGDTIKSVKLNKDTWEIHTQGASKVVIDYNYYSNKLDAGSTYFDHEQVYVNPVNCFLYLPDRINEPCKLKLEIPKDYKIASSLHFNETMEATAEDFHELADSPFIAAADLIHETYKVYDYTFHIWIKGHCKPDWNRIIKDFTAYTKAQIDMFGDMPVKEYHFLYQLPAFKFYHGVEHLASTVICLGPGFKLMENSVYIDFLGISSHELFHCWNVKAIRPVEMMPYDYSAENYSNLGYVAEGVTTYYGDLMLLRGKVYSWEQYTDEWLTFFQRHFHVFGYLYQTLAESSFDTWLDGYKPGVPDRKVNMYVKGMMVAFIIDTSIRRQTNNHKSLDDVMRELYNSFGKQGKGYSEEDYLSIINEVSGHDYSDFFKKYVWGLEPLEPALESAFEYIGCKIAHEPAALASDRYFGLKLKEEPGKAIVTATVPGSPSDKEGLAINDEIIAINDTQIASDIQDLLRFYSDKPVKIWFFRNRQLMECTLSRTDKNYYTVYKLVKAQDANPEQKENFRLFTANDF